MIHTFNVGDEVCTNDYRGTRGVVIETYFHGSGESMANVKWETNWEPVSEFQSTLALYEKESELPKLQPAIDLINEEIIYLEDERNKITVRIDQLNDIMSALR